MYPSGVTALLEKRGSKRKSNSTFGDAYNWQLKLEEATPCRKGCPTLRCSTCSAFKMIETYLADGLILL